LLLLPTAAAAAAAAAARNTRGLYRYRHPEAIITTVDD